MIKLHGFASSNYYNVPKLAMMEKGIEFEEVLAYTGFGPTYKPEYLDRTPLGKIPALETPEGFISESRAILDYIERANPQSPLLPDSAFGAAKVQELSQFIELYFELVARRLIPNLLLGTPPDPATLEGIRHQDHQGYRGTGETFQLRCVRLWRCIHPCGYRSDFESPSGAQRWHEIPRSGSAVRGARTGRLLPAHGRTGQRAKDPGGCCGRSASVHGTPKSPLCQLARAQPSFANAPAFVLAP